MQTHSLSVVRDCFFNIFEANLHIAGRFSIHNLWTPHAVVEETNLEVGCGLIWLRLGTGAGHKFGFHKMLEIS
jgi:hypothetical protein